MAKNFNELRTRMSPERVRRNEAEARSELADVMLSDLRRAMGVTQAELAERVGVTQASISQIERRGDMQIGTLRTLVEALGGKLRLIVELPSGTTLYQASRKKHGVTTVKGKVKLSLRRNASSKRQAG